MGRISEDTTVCPGCGTAIDRSGGFCPSCGSIDDRPRVCTIHPAVRAEGVCVLCRMPFCKKCGKRSAGVFLCDPHRSCEIQEGMVRVYGTIDVLQAGYVGGVLEQAGCHPFLFSRSANPNADLVAITKIPRGYGVGGHPIEDQRVFVPFDEYQRAVATLKELGLYDE